MKSSKSKSKSKLKISLKILGGILISLLLVVGAKALLIKNKVITPKINLTNVLSLRSSIKSVSAEEVYPMFECPCCGKPIDQCNCPMAEERKTFIDGLTLEEISEDKAIIAYVNKYGLESFIDKDKQKEFKEKLIQEAPADRPIITLVSDFYDFEDVSQKEGIKSTLFDIINEGKTDLIINRLESSCGCTFGSIIYKGEEGPKFSMPGHGINEEIGDWQVIIPPKGKAELKVYYDPSVHEDFRGVATRTVSIYSNDPVNFEKKVTIDLNQVD